MPTKLSQRTTQICPKCHGVLYHEIDHSLGDRLYCICGYSKELPYTKAKRPLTKEELGEK